ncbi:hypothetical protein L4D20_11825 [Vibrio kyushuensis]|uniref:hypothetical protein n=1 Tax=Vibrio TaxID=662 RepID=UPI003D0E7B34
MNYISLLLDAEAHSIVADLVDELESDQDGWIKMNARLASMVDAQLIESQYVGKVLWFSESDFIEQEIQYS